MDSGNYVPIIQPPRERRLTTGIVLAAAIVLLALALAATAAARGSDPTPISAGNGGGHDDKCVEYEWKRTLKAQKQVQGWEYKDGAWHQADPASWYPVPDSLQPPHYGDVAPTGTLPYGAYGIPAGGVSYRYEVFEPEYQWSTTKPEGEGWSKTGKTNRIPCKVPVPAQPTHNDPCGLNNATWNEPDDTAQVTWSVVDGHLIATTAEWFVFEDGTTSKDFGVAPDSGEACPPTDKPITGKGYTDHECDATEWHFVITQVDEEANAPASIHVVWENGASADVPLQKFTGGVAHYQTTANLDSSVVSITTTIYVEWSGQFNVSHGPCEPPPYECPEGTNWVDDGDQVVEEGECYPPGPKAMFVGSIDCDGIINGLVTINRDGLEGDVAVTVNGQSISEAEDGTFPFTGFQQPLDITVTIGDTPVPVEMSALVGPPAGTCTVPVPAQPPYNDPCGPNNATWVEQADTVFLDWTLRDDGHLVVAPKMGLKFEDGTTSKDFGVAPDSGEACPVVTNPPGSTTPGTTNPPPATTTPPETTVPPTVPPGGLPETK